MTYYFILILGISTMKKTTDECYIMYKNDPANAQTKDGRQITEIRTAPVYYIIMPASCNFGPPGTNKVSELDLPHLPGTIEDPNVPDRIQLAYAHQ